MNEALFMEAIAAIKSACALQEAASAEPTRCSYILVICEAKRVTKEGMNLDVQATSDLPLILQKVFLRLASDAPASDVQETPQ